VDLRPHPREQTLRAGRQLMDYSRTMSDMGLGRVKTALNEVGSESHEPRVSQAAIAAINGLIPTMFITLVRGWD
jgi:hypothetical protein